MDKVFSALRLFRLTFKSECIIESPTNVISIVGGINKVGIVQEISLFQ